MCSQPPMRKNKKRWKKRDGTHDDVSPTSSGVVHQPAICCHCIIAFTWPATLASDVVSRKLAAAPDALSVSWVLGARRHRYLRCRCWCWRRSVERRIPRSLLSAPRRGPGEAAGRFIRQRRAEVGLHPQGVGGVGADVGAGVARVQRRVLQRQRVYAKPVAHPGREARSALEAIDVAVACEAVLPTRWSVGKFIEHAAIILRADLSSSFYVNMSSHRKRLVLRLRDDPAFQRLRVRRNLLTGETWWELILAISSISSITILQRRLQYDFPLQCAPFCSMVEYTSREDGDEQ